MPERTDHTELDAALRRILAEPSTTARIITATADELDTHPFLTINSLSLDYAATIALRHVTDGLPDVVATEAITAATHAFPPAHPGERCGEYAVRLRDLAPSL
ncbi:hypothetical protein [Streptomyces flavidovirens]|uniref:hypothetical protein n=1 Tax=Streptomyces flavidovirens TaxID=67298 RepID=UPI000425AB90|nr:hypothetical protein [Streptomyces flavidovirens]